MEKLKSPLEDSEKPRDEQYGNLPELFRHVRRIWVRNGKARYGEEWVLVIAQWILLKRNEQMNFQGNIKVLCVREYGQHWEKQENWDGELHISLSIYKMRMILSAWPFYNYCENCATTVNTLKEHNFCTVWKGFISWVGMTTWCC